MQTCSHAEHDYVVQESSSHISTSDTPENFSQTSKVNSQKGKRITKTTRLSHSIKNNEHFLKINEEKATIDKKYKEEKIEIMKKESENKEYYYQQKTLLLQQILEELSLIRVALTQK